MKIKTETTPWNDGLVHAATGTKVSDGTRAVETACGLVLTQAPWFPMWGATGFASRVTCPGCTDPHPPPNPR